MPWFPVIELPVEQRHRLDGDPAIALRVFRIALVVYFGDEVMLGPMIRIMKMENSELACIVHRDNISERLPAAAFGPARFCLTDTDIAPLVTLFGQLIKGHQCSLLKTPIQRLMTAKASRATPSDSIVDLSIALEALYLSGDWDKGKALAERGAAFTGVNDAARKEIYIDLRSFYKVRNKILHDGAEHPTVDLKTGARKDSVQLRDWCFEHLRQVIRKLLSNDKYLTMDKKSFVRELMSTAKQWESQFQCIGKLNFYP